jgi:hypothetical protein
MYKGYIILKTKKFSHRRPRAGRVRAVPGAEMLVWGVAGVRTRAEVVSAGAAPACGSAHGLGGINMFQFNRINLVYYQIAINTRNTFPLNFVIEFKYKYAFESFLLCRIVCATSLTSLGI